MLDDALKRVAVLGAAGKMGSGISLLLLQEMACCEAKQIGKVGSGIYSLTLIDSNEAGLFSLRKYLRSQMTKYAEKNINALRKYYVNNSSLVSNEEIIRAFIDGAMDCVRVDSDLVNAKNATLIFEAIIEDVDVKIDTLSALKKISNGTQYYFTNTSSIPISLLNEKCYLQNRIIGYHFYNPPAVQRVLEVVVPKGMDSQLLSIATELAKRLQKIIVQSHDVAGFIGNGFLIPEIIFACRQARNLAKIHSLPLAHAIYLINQVTHDYLLRPMGIFQLIDYVGIDVCQNIAKIMQAYLPDPALHDSLIDDMISAGIKGGQHSDGTQKNGFFQYQNHAITGLYDLARKEYIPSFSNVEGLLGELPKQVSWKNLQKDPERKNKILAHFENLLQSDTLGASLAKDYLLHSRQICRNLVETKVADRLEDVDTVLKNGFFHLYGLTDVPLPSLEGISCKH